MARDVQISADNSGTVFTRRFIKNPYAYTGLIKVTNKNNQYYEFDSVHVYESGVAAVIPGTFNNDNNLPANVKVYITRNGQEELVEEINLSLRSSGTGTAPSGPVNWADVAGKPTFATVATSGSYEDLSAKPAIPNDVLSETVADTKYATKFVPTYSNSFTLTPHRAAITSNSQAVPAPPSGANGIAVVGISTGGNVTDATPTGGGGTWEQIADVQSGPDAWGGYSRTRVFVGRNITSGYTINRTQASREVVQAQYFSNLRINGQVVVKSQIYNAAPAPAVTWTFTAPNEIPQSTVAVFGTRNDSQTWGGGGTSATNLTPAGALVTTGGPPLEAALWTETNDAPGESHTAQMNVYNFSDVHTRNSLTFVAVFLENESDEPVYLTPADEVALRDRAGHTGTQAASTISDFNAASATRPVNAQTGTSYALTLTDHGKFITMSNAAASTLTVPTNATVAFPVGTIIEGAQLGAGQVTITPAGGVTINAVPGLKVEAQYGTFGLIKTATDTWLAFGRLAA